MKWCVFLLATQGSSSGDRFTKIQTTHSEKPKDWLNFVLSFKYKQNSTFYQQRNFIHHVVFSPNQTCIFTGMMVEV